MTIPRVARVVGRAAFIAAGGRVIARHLGYRLDANTVVRCRDGHLYTTLWVPSIKIKGLDLGAERLELCPIGRHWSLVRPVSEADLNAEQLAAARARHDIEIP